MNSLILDQYTHQSPLKRYLGNTLTGLGWSFWIYLWLPLLAAIAPLIGIHLSYQNNAASQTIKTMLSILSSHLTIVILMITIFLAWSILQWAGKHFRLAALVKQQAAISTSGKPFSHSVQDMQRWQLAQCMVVSHDDTNGIIQQVQVI